MEDATGLPLAGTGGSVQLPNNVTLCIKWTTENRGRSFRGRTYHVGLTESQVTDNEVVAVAMGQFTTAYGALLTDLATAGWPLVIASRYANNQPRITGVATLVTGFSIDPFIDSQRRRLPGRGR